jgi:hypothetical protein
VGQRLRAEYERAREAERTAQNFEDWRTDAITQAAAAWVLSCVFVRFLEDNRLIDPPKLSGQPTAVSGQPEKADGRSLNNDTFSRLQRARDEHELYFRTHPRQTDREYLLAVFDELAALPGTRDVFGPHNPLRELPGWLSGDAAGELLAFFQKVDADTGVLVHDFTDAQWDTRFLGDLYQDLSEAARKKYALLQTPDFVEAFILDRTLEPALDEFGLVIGHSSFVIGEKETNDQGPMTNDYFRMIDPACGSGHFLLGAFGRILDRWQRKEPGTNVRELVQRTLDSIHGVDVNPFAVAIARFRLLLAAMRACGVTRLVDAPAFEIHLACGDSLLHGAGEQQSFGWRDTDHATHAEDLTDLRRILRPGHYHAVVANPPYITPKDWALNQAYRERYSTCHMKYSLAVPFMERLFRLAISGQPSAISQQSESGAVGGAGYVGQITANSFMKREFGKKLIEKFLPRIDLQHVIDTSGAYVPGHGTPTVILFGQHRPPIASTIRTVMGIRGEPTTPDDPAQGLVWTAILDQIDQPGSQSEFVSVGDSAREQFGTHPWSIGGGGAAELKEALDNNAGTRISEIADAGVAVVTLEDEAFQLSHATAKRAAIPARFLRGFVIGDTVRDWQLVGVEPAVFPHEAESFEPVNDTQILKRLWPLRTGLAKRLWFHKTMPARGMEWFAYGHISTEKFRTPLSIVYGEVATHNHFVLDRGGKVFKQTAPVIKLPEGATEDDHLALLGLLNSSTACFWLKQVCHQKQMMGGDGIRIESKAKVPYAFNATAVGKLPIPTLWSDGPLRERLLELTRRIDRVSQAYCARAADAVLAIGEITAARHSKAVG